MNTLGTRLRGERDRLALSQDAFAVACGVTKNTQLNYESDRRLPAADYLVAAVGIGVDVLYVLLGKRAELGLATAQPDGDSPWADMTAEEDYLLRNYRATDDAGRAEILGTSAVQVDRAERRAKKPAPEKPPG